MNKLKKDELELFYRLDKKEYLVSENKNLSDWLVNISYSYQQQDIQNFIDKLSCWYLVKFPNKIFDKYQNNLDDILSKANKIMTLKALFQNLDLSVLELIDFDNCPEEQKEMKISFFQYLLKLAGYEMIYSKSTNPEYGIARVQFMFREFNNKFDWNLDINIYDCIMNYNYSMDNPLNVLLLKKLREKQLKEKNKKGKKKSRRRFFRS